MLSFKQLLEALSTHRYGEWQIVRTNHIGDRTERSSHMNDDDWHKFHHNVIKEIERRTRDPIPDGEVGFHSRSKGTKVVMNVDKKRKQLRHITHLGKRPDGKPMMFKKDTPEYRIESVETGIVFIEIE